MSSLTTPIHIVRESIGTITQILADKKVPVYQRGMSAFVAYDSITGEVNSITLPYLPDNASEQLIFAVQGFLDHEVGHILFSDAQAMIGIAHDKKLSQMHNVFEDPFVEKGMRSRFMGSAHNFSRLFNFFIDTVVEKNYRELIERKETHPLYYFSALAPAFSRAWHGVYEFQEYMKDKWEKIQPVMDVLPDDIAERVAAANSTQDNIKIARDVLLALEKGRDSLAEAARRAEMEDSDEGGVEDEEGDASEKDSSSKKRRRDEEGKKDKSKKESDDKKESAKSDSKGGDLSADEDDASEGGTGAPDSGDRDESLEDEEGDDDHTPTDEDGGEDADEDEDDGDRASTDEDGEDREDGEGEGESEEDEKDGEGDESVRGELPDVEMSSLEDSMSDEIARMAAEDAKRSDYTVYTTDYDEVKPLNLSKFRGDSLEKAMDRMISKVTDMASLIQSDLQRAFVAENRSYWQNAQHSGRINPSSLARLYAGDTRVFRRKVEHRTQDYDVSILIDCSGSMRSDSGGMSRIEAAMLSAYAIGAALDGIGVNFELIGFTSKENSGIKSEAIEIDEGKAGLKFSRTAALYMPIFKAFDENWGPECWRRLAAYIMDQSELRENADGECVMIAAKRLFTQPSSGKALLVLSDGSPACYSPKGYDFRAQSKHLKRVVHEVIDAGVKVFGIGIQTSSVKEYYPEYAVLNDISKLPSEVIGRISDVLLG